LIDQAEDLVELVKNAVPEEGGGKVYYLVIVSLHSDPQVHLLTSIFSHFIQAAIIVASHNPQEIGPFYRHLVDTVLASEPEGSIRLSSQIWDVLMKSWTLIGIPPVVLAASALARETDELGDRSTELSEKW
jgi:hypothetical protein